MAGGDRLRVGSHRIPALVVPGRNMIEMRISSSGGQLGARG
jgi:hypothetical protein